MGLISLRARAMNRAPDKKISRIGMIGIHTGAAIENGVLQWA